MIECFIDVGFFLFGGKNAENHTVQRGGWENFWAQENETPVETKQPKSEMGSCAGKENGKRHQEREPVTLVGANFKYDSRKLPSKDQETETISLDPAGTSYKWDCEGHKCRYDRFLVDENAELKGQLKAAQDENENLQTQLFHDKTAGSLESSNDKNSPLQLARKFSDIFGSHWPIIMEHLEKNDFNEVAAIQALSKLLKTCYAFCVEEVERRLNEIFFCDKCTKQDEELKEKWLVSRKIIAETGKSDSAVERILQKWLETSKDQRNYLEEHFKESEEMDEWREYLEMCLKSCWSIAVAYPPIKLDFPEPGEEIHTDIYEVYASQDPVYDEKIPKERVICVVWPAVTQGNGRYNYTKGTVLQSEGPRPLVNEGNPVVLQNGYQENKPCPEGATDIC